MKNEDTDQSLRHDPLDQNADENQMEDREFEFGADTDEVTAAEDSALNTDNDTAKEASGEFEESTQERALEAEIKALDVEIQADEQKHKGRQSTSEKAKVAAKTRQSTSEKAKIAEEEKAAALDPLRLRGKKYRAKIVLVDRTKKYPIEEALELVKQLATTSFVGAIELHAKVKGENIRGTTVLPHGNGKTRKVALANDDVLEEIAAGKLDFDVLLATPAQMPKLAKYAKLLGPKGLMPSPKSGTVTENPESVIAEINSGRVEYRADKTGALHLSIGKSSFTTEQLLENYRALEQILIAAKVSAITVAPTMGPGVKVALS